MAIYKLTIDLLTKTELPPTGEAEDPTPSQETNPQNNNSGNGTPGTEGAEGQETPKTDGNANGGAADTQNNTTAVQIDVLEFIYTPYSKWDKDKKFINESKPSVSINFKFKDESVEYTFKSDLVSIKYEKEMYNHNCVEFTLLCQNKTEGISQKASLKPLINAFKKAQITLESKPDETSEFQPVAQLYHIFSAQPLIRKSSLYTLTYITFKAYSPDKFLSMEKYCKAHVGKLLYKGIVTPELSSKIHNTHFKWENHFSNNFQILKCTSTKEGVEPDDLIQPYLVQYNEDFYNFLVRTLNRCGEFLYFEDKQLHLGCPNANKDFNKEDCIEIGNFVSYNQKVYHDAYGDDYNFYAEDFTDGQSFSSEDHVYNGELGANEYLGQIPRGGYTSWQDFKPVAQNVLWGIEGMLDKRNAADMLYYIIDFWTTQVVTAYETSNAKNTSIEDTYFLPPAPEDNASNKEKEDYEEKKKEAISKLPNADTYDARLGKAYRVKKDGTVDDSKEIDHIKLYSNFDASCCLANAKDKNLIFFSPSFYDNIKRGIQQTEQGRIQIRLGANYYPLKLGSVIKLKDEEEYFLVVKIKGNCFSRLLDSESAQKRENSFDLQKITDDPFKINRAFAYQETSLFHHIEEDCIIEAIPIVKDGFTFPTDSGRPAIVKSGAQRAFITENTDPMRLNRVRFRYAWQKDTEQGSPWVRLSTPMATKAGGINMLPVVNDEAIINFEYGNIERPYVEGMVHNKTHPPRLSHAWAGSRSISSANGHTINFDDCPLTTNAWLSSFSPLYGSFSSICPIKIPATAKIESEGAEFAPGGISMNDAWGMYKFVMSADKRLVMIDSPLGSVTLHAFTGINIVAPSGNIKIFGKNVDIIAGNKLTLTSGGNMKSFFAHNKNWTTAPTEGKDKRKNIGQNIGEQSMGVASDILAKCAPVDMTLLRTIWEALVRPVAGTLNIKATRYLILETGAGEAKIPNRRWMAKHFEHPGKYGRRKDTRQQIYNQFVKDIGNIYTAVNFVVETMRQIISQRAKDIEPFIRTLQWYKVHQNTLSTLIKEFHYPTPDPVEDLKYDDVLKDLLEGKKVGKDPFQESKLNELEKFFETGIRRIFKTKTKEYEVVNVPIPAHKGIAERLIEKAKELNEMLNDKTKLVNCDDKDLEELWTGKITTFKEITENALNQQPKTIKEIAKKFLDNNFDENKETFKKVLNVITAASKDCVEWKIPQVLPAYSILDKDMIDIIKSIIKTTDSYEKSYIVLPKDSVDTWTDWVTEFKKLNYLDTPPKPGEESSTTKFVNLGKKSWGLNGFLEDKIWAFTTPNTIMFANDSKTYAIKGTTIEELKDTPGVTELPQKLDNFDLRINFRF